MLRERQGALEPASRLRVRDARSLGSDSEGMFKGITCPVFALFAFRALTLLPETEVLPVFFGSEALYFPLLSFCLCFLLRRPQTPGRVWTLLTPWTLSSSRKVSRIGGTLLVLPCLGLLR